MATYLYCIRSDPVAPSDWLVGIDGARVRALEIDDLLAWVSDAESATVDANIERLKAHDAVCAAALESGDTPLPVRYGQTFADDPALIVGIETRANELRARLRRIAGCVELRVVITRGRSTSGDATGGGEIASSYESAAEEPDGPGTAFLKRLAQAGRAELAREVGCEEARHTIRAGATSLIVDQRRCETARGLAFFPVLVRREDVAAFQAAVANTLSSQGIDLSVLGPFAPYSFSGDA